METAMRRRTVRSELTRLVACCTLLLAVGCADSGETSERTIDGERIWTKRRVVSTAQEQPREVINFAVGPWQSPETMRRAYVPLLEYLSEKLQRQFVLNISPDYRTLKTDLKMGNTELVDFDPPGDAGVTRLCDHNQQAEWRGGPRFLLWIHFREKRLRDYDIEAAERQALCVCRSGILQWIQVPAGFLVEARYRSRIVF